jgi:hypothetical protein
VGPYTRQALTERRAAQALSGVHAVTDPEPSTGGVTAAERARRLYEQVGTLNDYARDADSVWIVAAGQQGDEDGTAIQQLADFLDTVRRALAHPTGPSARALAEALRCYEHDRTGGAS